MQEQLLLRLAAPSDAESLLDIYAVYVQKTNVTFEYEVPNLAEFKNRIAAISAKFPYVVAEVNGQIAGYAYVNTFRSRAAYGWGVETSIYVALDFQGRKLGEKLYNLLERIVKLQNITNLNASITYPNPQSIAFHHKMGYRKIAHFTKCGYKNSVWCDMIFMEKFINEHTVPAKEIIYLPKLDKELLAEIFADCNKSNA